MEPNKNTSVFLKHYDKSKWKLCLIADCLDYEQPGKYIIHTDIIPMLRNIPVLTANKSFIIGYTEESDNIYDKGAVIIYDDFTMDMKYVDFAFKVKSSAIKLLTAKPGYNLYFIYSLLKQMNLSQQEHARSYISKVGRMYIPIPDLDEQTKIADQLSKTDEHISNLEALISKQEAIKKTTVKLLLTSKPHWTEYKIKEKFKVTRGLVLSTNQMSKSQNGVFQYPVYSSQTQNNGLIGFYNNFLYQDAITWTTDGANAGFVRFRPGKFYCTNVCGVLLSDEGYANTCVATMLGNVSKKYVSYVGNPKLMNNVMAEIPLLFPSVQEQQYISDKIQKLDQQLEHLRSELDKYRNIKKGLMDYFFG